MDAVVVVLFVVLVNAACICSFSRAEKALRDLGSAWVRALLTASRDREEALPPPAGPRPTVLVRAKRGRALPTRPIRAL